MTLYPADSIAIDHMTKLKDENEELKRKLIYYEQEGQPGYRTWMQRAVAKLVPNPEAYNVGAGGVTVQGTPLETSTSTAPLAEQSLRQPVDASEFGSEM